eukprot:SAG31_NODE_424_length_15826_cov_4.954664_9_plen_185_part_00
MAAIVRSAQQLCSSSPVADSLRTVGLRGAGAVELALALQTSGLQTALDLRLLEADGEDATELMEQLRLAGISIGDRSKVRLLLGGRSSGGSTAVAQDDSQTVSSERASETPAIDDARITQKRQLQSTSETESDSISADTIAIVLSVLVGTVGYIVQCVVASTGASRCAYSLAVCVDVIFVHNAT